MKWKLERYCYRDYLVQGIWKSSLFSRINQAQRGRRSFSFHRPGKFQQLAQRMRAKVGGLFIIVFNPSYVVGVFLYPLKTSENIGLSDVFRVYRNRPPAWNGFDYNSLFPIMCDGCSIWHHLCNLWNMKSTHGGMLLLVTKSNSSVGVFTFLKLYKWCQIVQSISYFDGQLWVVMMLYTTVH